MSEEVDVIDAVDPDRKGPLPAEGYALRLYPIEDTDDIRLVDLWRVIWDGRWWILAVAVLGTVIGVVAASVITPVYRAEILMVPANAEGRSGGLAALAGQLGGIAALAGVNLGTDEDTAEHMAILESRAFTEQFIEKHNLMPTLFPDEWDEAKGSWNVADPAETPTLWQGYQLFDQSIRAVSQDAETGLVTLTIDWVDPQVARDWANDLVRDLNEHVRKRAIEQSKRSIGFLRDQLQDTTEVELRAAVFGLMEAEMKNAMLSTVRTEYAFEVIDPAVTPEKKYWPNRTLLTVVGFSAGLLFGVLLAFIRRSPLS